MTQLCRSQVGQFLINEAYMAEELMVHWEEFSTTCGYSTFFSFKSRGK